MLLIAYIIATPIASILIAEGALHPMRCPLTATEETEEIARIDAEGATLRDLSVAARDGVLLQAWFLEPRHRNGDAVILLHGLGDNRLGIVGYADLFLAHGYSVLMPDARAHGASGGAIATYGLLEADDIERWFDWLTMTRSPRCVYGFGESMGAAQLLQALPVATGFCAVAAECPFSTFREIAYDRMGQNFRTGPWLGRTVLRPLVEGALLYARRKYGLALDRVSPEEAVGASQIPVLLIHGQDDNNISIRHSRRIAASNPRVVLWEVPNASHTNAIGAAPEQFPARLQEFFASHDRSEPGK
jgi:pimeloyl-ACP methyl ester carboxylesterase